jgi:hypothetical protein
LFISMKNAIRCASNLTATSHPRKFIRTQQTDVPIPIDPLKFPETVEPLFRKLDVEAEFRGEEQKARLPAKAAWAAVPKNRGPAEIGNPPTVMAVRCAQCLRGPLAASVDQRSRFSLP